jgi:hypothetical protein
MYQQIVCEFCGGPHDDGHMEEWMEYTSKLLDYTDELIAEVERQKIIIRILAESLREQAYFKRTPPDQEITRA